ncbi:hypothetical protein EXIGLDRAFT_194766 [Exidia glandulosa HHB12029]|uniref:C2H2-type domain-containing protein n=1 Tax=Exidia glandulosa HHB12029 TaxID=1314781 RepID=A0A165EW53_EXIGL|nr:hypothetical protein EXIGLDRAFT_194766 [Exidia glandulosa HHB12029]
MNGPSYPQRPGNQLPSLPPISHGRTPPAHPLPSGYTRPPPPLPPMQQMPQRLPTMPYAAPRPYPQPTRPSPQQGGGSFMILESNPTGNLNVTVHSSVSMQHAEWLHSGTVPASESAADRTLRCTAPGCTRTFLTRQNLDRHMRMAHAPGVVQPPRSGTPNRPYPQ